MSILLSISATINAMFLLLFAALYFQWLVLSPVIETSEKESQTTSAEASSDATVAAAMSHDFSKPASMKD